MSCHLDGEVSSTTRVAVPVGNGEPRHDGDGECTNCIELAIVDSVIPLLMRENDGDGRDQCQSGERRTGFVGTDQQGVSRSRRGARGSGCDREDDGALHGDKASPTTEEFEVFELRHRNPNFFDCGSARALRGKRGGDSG